MTEAEWLRSADLAAMLSFLGDKASHRKFRLFACACVRRSWHLLTDERSRQAVAIAEQFADGLASKAQLDEAASQAKAAAQARGRDLTVQVLPGSGAQRAKAQAAADVRVVAVNACWAAAWTAVGVGKVAAWAAAKNSERAGQPDLLREIAGNPFHPLVLPDCTPALRILAAEAYAVAPANDQALQQKLTEDGHGKLAEHFAAPDQPHPKGCWVVDLVLGKS